VVKAFNHIQAGHITEHAQPDGTPRRRALVIAGDDPDAKATVRGFIHQIGFDVVDAGTLADSWRIEPGAPGYGPRLDVEEMHEALDAATRG
jgi:predicted dinucleotide-binding enzyme